MGTGIPIFIVLITACWLYLLRSISIWMGKTPVAGREIDKWMLQLNSGIAVLVIWILLGGLLLLTNSKGVLPLKIGLISWILLPFTGLLALVALAAMFDPGFRWAVIAPTAAPMLIVLYALYYFLPSQPLSSAQAGFIIWIVATSLLLVPLPFAIRLAQVAGENGSISAEPGPELDRWMAKQREARRQSELAELKKIDEDTVLGDIESLTRGDSPVRTEALDAMRRLPGRQAQAEKALLYEYFWILPLLPEIDIQPTPELCRNARAYLQHQIAFQKKQFPEPAAAMLDDLEKGLPGIGWLAGNCDCGSTLDELDAVANAQQGAPAIRKFRETLAAFPRLH